MGATTTSTSTTKPSVPKRKKAPSKAPRRLLKKQLRDIERLIKNKNKESAMDLPEQVLQENSKKAEDLKRQLEALGPEPVAKTNKTVEMDKPKNSKAIRFTEMRRAGRKIVAFKKQHPDYEKSEEESKSLADLELDLSYTKNFPKNEDYISLYPEPPLEDEEKRTRQKEIREQIAKALASGETMSSAKLDTEQKTTKAESTSGDYPASNWSDDDEHGGEDDDEDDEDDSSSESESENEGKPVAKRTKSK